MDNLTLRVPHIVGQGELRGKEHSSRSLRSAQARKRIPVTSNHGFPRFWNAEVNVHAMTSTLPRDCNLNSRDYAALSSSSPWRHSIICAVSKQNWEEPLFFSFAGVGLQH